MALHLLWARATKYPKSFGGSRAILDVQFSIELNFPMLKLHDRGNMFKILEELIKYTIGERPSFGKKWHEYTHLYFPLCTHNHWIAIEVDFFKTIMFVYDPDESCIIDYQLKDDLKGASIKMSLLLKEINVDVGKDTLAIERATNTTKQAVSGDCDMYIVKYIEFLSINIPVKQVNGFYMARWRERMAADMFALDYDP